MIKCLIMFFWQEFFNFSSFFFQVEMLRPFGLKFSAKLSFNFFSRRKFLTSSKQAHTGKLRQAATRSRKQEEQAGPGQRQRRWPEMRARLALQSRLIQAQERAWKIYVCFFCFGNDSGNSKWKQERDIEGKKNFSSGRKKRNKDRSIFLWFG